jgi:hypothetical protein
MAESGLPAYFRAPPTHKEQRGRHDYSRAKNKPNNSPLMLLERSNPELVVGLIRF